MLGVDGTLPASARCQRPLSDHTEASQRRRSHHRYRYDRHGALSASRSPRTSNVPRASTTSRARLEFPAGSAACRLAAGNYLAKFPSARPVDLTVVGRDTVLLVGGSCRHVAVEHVLSNALRRSFAWVLVATPVLLAGSKRIEAWNALSRGLTKLGVGHSEGTLVETALPTGTAVVPAERVAEAGGPSLKEPLTAASWQG